MILGRDAVCVKMSLIAMSRTRKQNTTHSGVRSVTVSTGGGKKFPEYVEEIN
jgi:threonine synthase